MNRPSPGVRLTIITLGLLLIIAGVLLPIIGVGMNVYRWIFSAGALVSLAGRILNLYDGPVLRIKRLYRIELWSSIFFCVAAFFMFYPGGRSTDWLAFTLAGGALLIYTSIMIPRESAKAAKHREDTKKN